MNENIFRAAFLLILMTFLLILFGAAAGGPKGAVTAFFFACILNFSSYWFSDRIILSIYRAQPVKPGEQPGLYESVQMLAHEAGMPMPKIYLIPSASANAFATGRDPAHASVAVTQGILEALGPEELSGVLAHELSHIKHYDMLIATLAATLAGAITMLADGLRWMFIFGGQRSRDEERANPLVLLLMMILMPVAAVLIQLALSRGREFEADRGGGVISKNPLYLASALRKIDSLTKKIPMREVHPASAHLFIHQPLKRDSILALFNTHPPVDERIARLEKQARQMGI